MSLLPVLIKIKTLTEPYQQKERKELESKLTITILQKRRNELLLNNDNSEELKIISKKLDYLFYGIK